MNNDARLLARQYYLRHDRDWLVDVEALAANPRAVVVNLPNLVVLLKPVCIREPMAWLDLRQSPEAADAWYVHLLVGDVALALSLARDLDVLPWLCFQRGARDSRGHCYSWARFVARRATLPTSSI